MMAHATRLRLPSSQTSVSGGVTLRAASSASVRPSGLAPRMLRMRAPLSATNGDGPSSSTTTSTTTPAAKKEEVPIWVRREAERRLQEQTKPDLPWGIYLLASTLTAIAAVGCIFEYVDRNPFFGLISPDSPAWAPILITLAVSGFPTAGYLFYKGVTGFNEAAERQDRLDGYLDE